MDSCGPPMFRQRWGSKRSESGQPGQREIRSGIACAARGLVLLSLLAGCAPTMRFGSPPMTNNLKTLKVGASTPADVLLALGQPRGDGATRLPGAPKPRKIWFYDYVEAAGGVTRGKILLVFFDQEKYDGHLWFSALLDRSKPREHFSITGQRGGGQ